MIEADGKVAGLFKASFLKDKDQWYLFQIQVHPDFQNLKIGRRLVKGLIERADKEGKAVGLSCLKSNPALNIYTRLGFKVIDEDLSEFELLYHPQGEMPTVE